MLPFPTSSSSQMPDLIFFAMSEWVIYVCWMGQIRILKSKSSLMNGPVFPQSGCMCLKYTLFSRTYSFGNTFSIVAMWSINKLRSPSYLMFRDKNRWSKILVIGNWTPSFSYPFLNIRLYYTLYFLLKLSNLPSLST